MSALRGNIVDIANRCAFTDHAVGELKVHAKCTSDWCPAVVVTVRHALLHDLSKNFRAILLDALNVLEEAIPLLLQSRSCEFGSWSRCDHGWIQGVEHRHTVVLVKRHQRELVDEDLR